MNSKKIVIIGPESTGKSTLSAALAEALQTVWVPEYAREYLENLNTPYREEDLLRIAEGQMLRQDTSQKQATNYLICDTDLYVIKVWSEHKYGRCDLRILEGIATERCDLYLLTGIDIPWEDDPLREHPSADMRTYFYQIYLDIVIHSGFPWICINGTPEDRIRKALAAIEQLQRRNT